MEFITRVIKTKNLALMIFLVLRYLILPLKKVSIYLPKKGTFIEVGCGHGIISYFLAKDEAKRNILAIDPDKGRIVYAKKMFNDVNNLKFKNSLFDKNIKEKYDCIIFFGVLYLFNDKKLAQILNSAKKKLNKNGVLYISDLKKKNDIVYKLHLLREKIFKKIKFTRGHVIKARTEIEWFNILNNVGYKKIQKVYAPVIFHSTIDIKSIK